MNKAELVKALAELLANKMEMGEEPTNGEVIQALFPNAYYNGGKLFMHIINVNNIGEITIPWQWWNAPYKAEKGSE